MRASRKILVGLTAGLITLSGAATPAMAAGKSDHPERFQTLVSGPTNFILEEGKPATFFFTGIARGQNAKVVWTDGGETILDTSKACKPAQARKDPTECMIKATHTFTQYGAGSAILWVDGLPRSSGTVDVLSNTVVPAEDVQVKRDDTPVPPHDWSLLFSNGSAGFAPCATISWSFDGTTVANNPNQQQLVADVVLALDMLSEKSGLTFIQVDGYDANLVFSSGSMAGTSSLDALGYFSGGPGGGKIILSDTSPYMTDQFAGAEESFMAQRPDQVGSNKYVMGFGRAWTIIHEVMHALGFGHVDNGAYELMNSNARMYAGWGPGDLEGLATLYPRTNCPA